ncbi:MAG: hypothetical protein WBM50_12820 [Acidimicrobiales bacterium]
MNLGGKFSIALLLSSALIGAACGSDSDDTEAGDGDTATTEADGGGTETTEEGGDLQNACPAEGCIVDFADVAASDDEIEVTWKLNFDPDINNNHIHIYWDNFTAAQVSNDATERGVEQGEWVPTDLGPSYVTDGAASTSVRGESTTLCLVAADRDHNVIDEETEICRDVSELL